MVVVCVVWCVCARCVYLCARIVCLWKGGVRGGWVSVCVSLIMNSNLMRNKGGNACMILSVSAEEYTSHSE